MGGDAEAQAGLQGRIPPKADDVLVRPVVYGVPLVIGGIEAIDVVVMRGEGDDILCAAALYFATRASGSKFSGFPGLDDVDVADLGGMAVMFEVPFVFAAALGPHVVCVVVANARDGVGSPMGPDAELGVLEPLRALVGFEGVVRGGEEAGGGGGCLGEGWESRKENDAAGRRRRNGKNREAGIAD